MTEAVIVAAARTPIGRSYKGSLVDVDAFTLAEIAVRRGHRARAGIDGTSIDDIVLAESLQGGGVHRPQRRGPPRLDICPRAGRQPALCGGPQRHRRSQPGSIRSGMDRVVVAGGHREPELDPEGHSRRTRYPRAIYKPWFSPTHPPTPEARPIATCRSRWARTPPGWRASPALEADDMGTTTRTSALPPRDDQGLFAAEIVPVPVVSPTAQVTMFEADEQPRADTSIGEVGVASRLHPELPDATVTAGNSSGINDGAAAVVVTADDFAAVRRPHRARSGPFVGIRRHAPDHTGLAPTLAIPKALERAGMKMGDVDLFEINEAFCSMAVACTRHPRHRPRHRQRQRQRLRPGAPGGRHRNSHGHHHAARTSAPRCERRFISMCAGGGMGAAMVIEIV